MIVRELLIRLGVVGGRESEQTFNRIDNGVKRLDNSVRSLSAPLANLNGILMGLFAGVSAAGFIKIADTMQGLRDQIGNATGGMQGAADMLDKLGEHATRGRVAVDEYASSWSKMHTGVKSFGGTTQDTTKFMDTLTAAFKSNGTPAETVSSALFQLGQSMQSGVIQGEEMNSLIDAQGELFNDLAVSIAGSVPAYKKLQSDGKVTSKMLLEAVNKQYDKYADRLRLAPMKVGDAITVVGNKWKLFTDRMNRETKFVQKIANGIIAVFDKIETKSGELIEKFGGIERVLSMLGLILTSGGIVVGIYAIGAAIAFITSPFATLIAFISSLLIILDDFMVWRAGGKSILGGMFGKYSETMKPIEDAVVGMLKKIDEHVGILKTSFTILGVFLVGKWAKNLISMFGAIREQIRGVREDADPEGGSNTGGGSGERTDQRRDRASRRDRARERLRRMRRRRGGKFSLLFGKAKDYLVDTGGDKAKDYAAELADSALEHVEGFVDEAGGWQTAAELVGARAAGIISALKPLPTNVGESEVLGKIQAGWMQNIGSANMAAMNSMTKPSQPQAKSELKTIEYKPNITVQLTTPTNDPAGVEFAVLSATEKTQRGFTEWLSNEIAFNTGAK